MTNLKNYLEDGANYQAQAVLAFVKREGQINDSWNDELREYEANPQVARWENGREQGYIISLLNKQHKQLNIAFFEHRNSDSIHALKWEQWSMNSLTFDTADFGGVYKHKYDTSFSVSYGEITEMADWIVEQLNQHWVEGID